MDRYFIINKTLGSCLMGDSPFIESSSVGANIGKEKTTVLTGLFEDNHYSANSLVPFAISYMTGEFISGTHLETNILFNDRAVFAFYRVPEEKLPRDEERFDLAPYRITEMDFLTSVAKSQLWHIIKPCHNITPRYVPPFREVTAVLDEYARYYGLKQDLYCNVLLDGWSTLKVKVPLEIPMDDVRKYIEEFVNDITIEIAKDVEL